MPTTIYTKNKNPHWIGHGGKQYAVEKGQVSVPDDAVPVFCESHGFSETPFVEKTDKKEPEKQSGDEVDVTAMTREQLIAYAKDKLGLTISARASKAEALDAVISRKSTMEAA